jgi:hypothetical protein
MNKPGINEKAGKAILAVDSTADTVFLLDSLGQKGLVQSGSTDPEVRKYVLLGLDMDRRRGKETTKMVRKMDYGLFGTRMDR